MFNVSNAWKMFVVCITALVSSLIISCAAIGLGNKVVTGKHIDVDFSLSCNECHIDVTPDIVADWKSSGHGRMNFGCYICHGDGEVEFYPVAFTEKCITCHSNNEEHLSEHKNRGCFRCHDGHTLIPHE